MVSSSFSVKINPKDTLLKFDQQVPVYNWYYPFASPENPVLDAHTALSRIEPAKNGGRRALYFHIPFCDTICTFCPFHRSAAQNKHDIIDNYVDALIREIELKSAYEGVGKAPVHSIAFGGGTPSVLSVAQIEKIGAVINSTFDLSELQEYTFELEVKSVTLEKLEAIKRIGVRRVSFGIQTFNPRYRKLFNLTSTIEQIEQVAKWTTEMFDFVNIDIIYGMSGQSLEELTVDVEKAMTLGTTTIDLYPINNYSASMAMHQMAEKQGLQPLSHQTKVSFRLFMDEYMRARGYVPVTGFSYTKMDVQKREAVHTGPCFVYHDIVNGYNEDQCIGFGASAFSTVSGMSIGNVGNTQEYIDALAKDTLPLSAHGDLDAPEKGIIYFPFRGNLIKDRIEWDRIPAQTRAAFDEAIAQGLVEDAGDVYKLTSSGWLFYVNLIYYFMPDTGRLPLNGFIDGKVAEGRITDETRLYQLDESAESLEILV